MNGTLLGTGIACIIAAIIGGGLKAFGLEIPILNSIRRQIILAGFGIVLVIVSQMHFRSTPPSEAQKKLEMEISHRAHAALAELQVDQKDITAGEVPYPPSSIYYNVVNYLNNSFPKEDASYSDSVFAEYKTVNFEMLVRQLVLIRGEKPMQPTWDGFKELQDLADQPENAARNKQKCLDAVAKARQILTTKVLAHISSSMD